MTIKLIEPEVKPATADTIIDMGDMKPLQVCVLERHGDKTVLMRTASIGKFEVINITRPGNDTCWTDKNNLRVRELRENEEYTLKLTK